MNLRFNLTVIFYISQGKVRLYCVISQLNEATALIMHRPQSFHLTRFLEYPLVTLLLNTLASNSSTRPTETGQPAPAPAPAQRNLTVQQEMARFII